MACLAPLGPVYQAGTLSGNPLATAAGLAALDAARRRGAYDALAATATRLADGLRRAIAGAGLPIVVPVVGPLVGLHFSATPAVDYDSAKTTDEALYAAFFHAMLGRGVALAPGPYEVAFPGLAHDDDVIDEVVAAAEDAANEVGQAPPRLAIPRGWTTVGAVKPVSTWRRSVLRGQAGEGRRRPCRPLRPGPARRAAAGWP